MKVGTVAGKKTRLLSSLLFSLFFFFSSCHYIFLPFLSSSFILPRCLVWGIGVWLSVEEDRGCLDFNDGLDDNLDLVRDLDAWPVYLIENCSLIHQFFLTISWFFIYVYDWVDSFFHSSTWCFLMKINILLYFICWKWILEISKLIYFYRSN